MTAVGVAEKSRSERDQTVYIKTFGCQMNEYDSAKLLKILEDKFRQVATAEQADLVILNSCSVREKPELKVYSLLGELEILKRTKPHLIVGVGGCVAQQQGRRLLERTKVVDFVFGTHNLSLVPTLIGLCQTGQRGHVAVDYREDWEDLPLGFSADTKISAFIPISRGCDKHCAYCVVPTTRGPAVSRPLAEIEREIRWAVARGAKEVLLLGQTVNSYGRDLGGQHSFEGLLERVAAIDGLLRIRFTSPHPQELTSAFIEFLGASEKICKHIHLPLQSGSDRILQAMNRQYRQADYLNIVARLKEKICDLAITTDLIVGFPGETESDFEETLAVMEQVQFDNSFSFVYSARGGTSAAALEETLSQQEKLERLKRLQIKQQQISSYRLAAWVGRDLELLLEGETRAAPECLRGRSSQNIMVNLTQPDPHLVPGMLVVARVLEASKFTLRASPVRVVQAD